MILTAGTDGHIVLWPLDISVQQQPFDSPPTTQSLTWKEAFSIHQSSSKTLTMQSLKAETTLIASGGDDGSLAFYISTARAPFASVFPPMILTRAHASAVTACATLSHHSRIFVLTSGNDQWVRLWEVVLRADVTTQRTIDRDTRNASDGDPLSIKRIGRIKTNVADVSSMAVLGQDEKGVAKVLICGVGMEVICVDWEDV
jgi:WD40 repeat protein